jgi:hypothetical protein
MSKRLDNNACNSTNQLEGEVIMALYLVVRHPDDDQAYSNSWNKQNRDLLEAITTDATVIRLCTEAMRRQERVFIYRCGLGGGPARICCSALIKQADRAAKLVTFCDQKSLNQSPPRLATQGQNYFED